MLAAVIPVAAGAADMAVEGSTASAATPAVRIEGGMPRRIKS
jgi:hypothetical protein